MNGRMLARVAWFVLVSALVPAAFLAAQRVASEGAKERVAVVMDEQALATQAALVGLTSIELGLRYQALGLPGIALYEDTIESLVAKGSAAALLGSELRAQALARGEPAPAVPSDATLVTALAPGALDTLLAKNVPAGRAIEIAGRTWYVWPGDVRTTLPAGPDLAQIDLWRRAGFDVAYRPRNAPVALLDAGADYPAGASYLIYAGTQVAGHPGDAASVIEASQDYLTAIIEGTPQSGMPKLSGRVPTVRLLSFNQDYVDRRLRPADLVDKYLLAVDERNVRLLYLRPYTTNELGDPIANTEALVRDLSSTLASQGYQVGPLRTDEPGYVPHPWLRAWSALGVLAGLLLLTLRFAAPWGLGAAAGVAVLALAAAGASWDAVALAAALVFPVLGYLTFRERPATLVWASLVSLAGALLLAAVGSERDTLSAVRPFTGVGATLVVPPALFLVGYALRFRRPVAWIRLAWRAEIRVWHVAFALAAVAVAALVVLRRGNDPVIGVSSFELALRDLLGSYFARPRFKELIGHPLAFLALALPGLPAWMRGTLLSVGVVAQASILNSFSHYHTPLAISLERTLVALVLGALIGLVLWPLAAWTLRRLRAWMRTDDAVVPFREG